MALKNANDGFRSFSDSIKANKIDCLYIFHGDERYLLERSIDDLRRKLCPNGLSSFNYKRYEGKSLSLNTLEEAIDTLPSSAERTFIEIHDFDIFKSDDKSRLIEIFSDLPDYVCILFVYNVTLFKPDRRVKINTELLKHAQVVEFSVQDAARLVKWIKRHFEDADRKISDTDAEYLAFITGGYMSALYSEISKIAAFASNELVTRNDIDAVVIPALDAVAYKLTDALVRCDYANAMCLLDELFQMKEAPHKLLFSISLKMRQLLTARVCIESNAGKKALVDICGIRHDFQARALLDSAAKISLSGCAHAVTRCAITAYELNSSSDPQSSLTELITYLSRGV